LSINEAADNLHIISQAMKGKSSQAKVTSEDFYLKVHEVVAQIPVGRVTTYGAIAAFLGARSSSRLVGYALKNLDDDMDVPCHRVVNRNGELSGKHNFATPTLMRDLLESEGIQFLGEAVIMEKYFWDPATGE
jgi:methylated-DNA-protein-cysteine methyltransferase-like protein